jgi:hypothetical protein
VRKSSEFPPLKQRSPRKPVTEGAKQVAAFDRMTLETLVGSPQDLSTACGASASLDAPHPLLVPLPIAGCGRTNVRILIQ